MRVGLLTAPLIDRPPPFHAACDAESAELQEFDVSSLARVASRGTRRSRATPQPRQAAFCTSKTSICPIPSAWSTHSHLRCRRTPGSGGRTSKKSLL